MMGLDIYYGVLWVSCFLGGGLQQERYNIGNSHQHQSLQENQEARPKGGPHHREAGKATEAGGGTQEEAEAPRVPQCCVAAWQGTQVS